MVLQVQIATEADAQRAADIEKVAYGPNPLGPCLFPPIPSPSSPPTSTSDPSTSSSSASLTPRASQILDLLQQDPISCRWAKVVDTDLPSSSPDSMIAFSCWYFYKDESPVQGPQTWGPGTNPEACETFFGGMRVRRNERYGGRPFAYLRLLHTHPDHKRRGAGTMLLQWGAAEADRLGLESYLEASPEGKPLYEKSGYSVIDTLTMDFSQWGGPDGHSTALMVRSASE